MTDTPEEKKRKRFTSQKKKKANRKISEKSTEEIKAEAKAAYEARKEREAEEAALTPLEKEARALLREEERLKKREEEEQERTRRLEAHQQKVQAEAQRIKAEETKRKLEEKPLTLAQLSKLFFTPCKTRADLKAWIKFFLGLDLPDCTVSRYADSNPLDIIWEIYNLCVHKKNPHNIEELLVVASRGSGKTLSVAIIEFLLLFHDQRDVAHVGAILSQAKRCYEYQMGFMLSDKVKKILDQTIEGKPMVEKQTQEKSLFNLKDRYTGETVRVSCEVLPCTLKACLVSTSEISTPTGIRPVNLLRAGDLVSAPGYNVQVVENIIDYVDCIEVELDDGRIIRGTLDHRVWTSEGWVELQHLNESHNVLKDCDLQESLPLFDLSSKYG